MRVLFDSVILGFSLRQNVKRVNSVHEVNAALPLYLEKLYSWLDFSSHRLQRSSLYVESRSILFFETKCTLPNQLISVDVK